MASIQHTGLTEMQSHTLGRLAAHEVSYRRKLDLYRQSAQKRLTRIKRSTRTLQHSVVDYNNKLKQHSDFTDDLTTISGVGRDARWTRYKRHADIQLSPSTGCQAPIVREVVPGVCAHGDGGGNSEGLRRYGTVAEPRHCRDPKSESVSESVCGNISTSRLTSALSSNRYSTISGDQCSQQNLSGKSSSSQEQWMNELTLATTKRLVPLNVAYGDCPSKSYDRSQNAAQPGERGDTGKLLRFRIPSTSEDELDASSSRQTTFDDDDEEYRPNDNCISFLELIRLRQLCGLSKYPNLLVAITKKIEKETLKARMAAQSPVITSERRPVMVGQSRHCSDTGDSQRPLQANTARHFVRTLETKEMSLRLAQRAAHRGNSSCRDGDLVIGCLEKVNDALVRERQRMALHKTSGAIKLPIINEERKRELSGSPSGNHNSSKVPTRQDKRRKNERQRRFGRQEEFARVRPHLSISESHGVVECPSQRQCLPIGRSPLRGITRENTARTRLVSASVISLSSSSSKDNEYEETTKQMERRLKQQQLQRLEQGNVLTWKESLASVRECHYLNS